MKKILLCLAAIVSTFAIAGGTAAIFISFNASKYKTILTQTIQDALNETVKGKIYKTKQEAKNAIEKTEIEGIKTIVANPKIQENDSTINDILFDVTVTPEENYVLENGKSNFEVTTIINETDDKLVLTDTIQKVLDETVKNQVYKNVNEVINALELTSIHGIANIEAQEAKTKDKNVKFNVQVTPKKEYTLENGQSNFEVTASITETDDKIVLTATIQRALNETLQETRLETNEIIKEALDTTEINGIENIKSKENGLDENSFPIFKVIVTPYIDYKLEGTDTFIVRVESISIEETVYIDSQDQKQSTTKQDFSKIDVKEILKLGIFENGETIQYFKGEKVKNVLPKEITSLNRFASNNDHKEILGIEKWETSNVTNMSNMFFGAKVFNQNIGDWDTSNVADMGNMFDGASSFNQEIGNWITSNVVSMYSMFKNASSFNQSLVSKKTKTIWDTSKVTDMRNMFEGAKAFNQDVNWITSKVTDMSHMFDGAESFNKEINAWDTSNVIDMSHMFAGASKFNQPIKYWDPRKVIDMSYMFQDAKSFNQDMDPYWIEDKFLFENVLNMSHMFDGAESFNKRINGWNTSKVTDMSYMFAGALSFNQEIAFVDKQSWNELAPNWWYTGSVTNMDHMFHGAISFNQDISNWHLRERVSHVSFDTDTLEGWTKKPNFKDK